MKDDVVLTRLQLFSKQQAATDKTLAKIDVQLAAVRKSIGSLTLAVVGLRGLVERSMDDSGLEDIEPSGTPVAFAESDYLGDDSDD